MDRAPKFTASNPPSDFAATAPAPGISTPSALPVGAIPTGGSTDKWKLLLWASGPLTNTLIVILTGA